MPTSVAGNSANYPATITCPIGADSASAPSVTTPLTELADRTAHSDARLDAVDLDLTAINYALASQTQESAASAGYTTVLDSYQTIDTLSIAGVEVGDKIEATVGPLSAIAEGGGGGGWLAVRVTDGGATYDYECLVGTTQMFFTIPIIYTVGTAGTLTISLMHMSIDGASDMTTNICLLNHRWIIAKILRPIA